MKKLFILTVLLISSLSFGQKLTTTQLIDLCDQSLGEVQEYMIVNNWHFYEATDETEKNYGNAKFVYDRPKFDQLKQTAAYFITYYYSEVDKTSAIDIYFRDKNYYESFLGQIQNLKYKLTDSKAREGNIIKIYKRGGQIIEVTIPPNFEGTNSYRFLFAKKSDYKKIRVE